MKKHIKIIIPTILLGLISIVYFATNGFNTRPFKVIDPFDSRFNAQEFRFEDYKKPKDLQAALDKMFPKETPLSDVEAVLVGAAGAHRLRNFSKREQYHEFEYIYEKEALVRQSPCALVIKTKYQSGSLRNINSYHYCGTDDGQRYLEKAKKEASETHMLNWSNPDGVNIE